MISTVSLATASGNGPLPGQCVQVTVGSDVLNFRFITVDIPNSSTTGVTSVVGINNWRQMVGYYGPSSTNTKAYFLPFPGGKYVDITVPFQATGAASFTEAYKINNLGAVVGFYTDTSGIVHGWFLDHVGGNEKFVAPIDPPGSGFTRAFGINDFNNIVGAWQASASGGDEPGFFLPNPHSNNFVTPIYFPPGPLAVTATIPLGINDRGEIVGEYYVTALGQWFSFHGDHINGPFEDISPPVAFGALYSQPFQENNFGETVGYFTPFANAAFPFHGWILKDGIYTQVDFPGAGPKGTAIDSVNDWGDFTGRYYDTNGQQHGFIALISDECSEE